MATPIFYVYRHIRPDTNQVFYIGRGKVIKFGRRLYRAYSTNSRNTAWKEVVAKNGGSFTVEIMFISEDETYIDRKEIEFIALYGKMENGGTLVNRDNGGRAPTGFKHTEEARQKMRESHKNNPHRSDFLRSDEFKRKRMKKMRLYTPRRGYTLSEEHKAAIKTGHVGAIHPQSKAVIDTATGVIYPSVRAAEVAVNYRNNLHKQLAGKRQNNSTFRYYNGV